MFLFTTAIILATFGVFFLLLGLHYSVRRAFVVKPALARVRIRTERIKQFRQARRKRALWKEEHFFLGDDGVEIHEEHQRLLRQEIGTLMLFLGYATDMERCSWQRELTRLVGKMSFERPTLV
ncbi:hypothetical protein EPO17_03415 [Patescibacteria group bacterium]|nr:MAG: hypothetical protein EPO17_03415 [Patescibacteria group bacterium]